MCVLSHGAHAVSPKAPFAKTRWCSLFCYRKEDDRVPPPLIGVPPRWVSKADDPQSPLPAVLRELLVGRPGSKRQKHPLCFKLKYCQNFEIQSDCTILVIGKFTRMYNGAGTAIGPGSGMNCKSTRRRKGVRTKAHP